MTPAQIERKRFFSERAAERFARTLTVSTRVIRATDTMWCLEVVQSATMPYSLRLTEPQMRRLHALRLKTGLKINEMIRRAVDEYLDREDTA